MRGNEFTWEENFSFWKNLFFVAVFFTITPITLGVSLFSLFSLSKISTEKALNPDFNLATSPKSGVRIYASLPNSIPSIDGAPESVDARGEIVRQYLQRYESNLEPHSDYIVQVADKYELDFRLIPAIAQQESNLCKIIPPDSYNCWGWGIHSKGSLGFESYEEAIETVSKGLREEYLDKGYLTAEEIMSKYTPMSNGSWAFGVNQFMAEME